MSIETVLARGLRVGDKLWGGLLNGYRVSELSLPLIAWTSDKEETVDVTALSEDGNVARLTVAAHTSVSVYREPVTSTSDTPWAQRIDHLVAKVRGYGSESPSPGLPTSGTMRMDMADLLVALAEDVKALSTHGHLARPGHTVCSPPVYKTD